MPPEAAAGKLWILLTVRPPELNAWLRRVPGRGGQDYQAPRRPMAIQGRLTLACPAAQKASGIAIAGLRGRTADPASGAVTGGP